MLRSSGFLSKFRLDKNRGDLVYLASNRRSHEMPNDVLQFYTFMDANQTFNEDEIINQTFPETALFGKVSYCFL